MLMSASRAVAAACARLSELKFVGVDWLPDVVPWSGATDVSHWINFTRSRGTQSSSATSCVCTVNMPCPKSHFPVYAVTVPSAETAIHESSFLGSTWEGCVSNGPCTKANGLASETALKLTINAPEVFKKSRRETLMLSSRQHIFESPASCARE